MTLSKKSLELDIVRCMMNYMIVLLHAWAAFQYVSCSGIEFFAWTFICSHLSWLAIPGFFMISGYLLFKGYSLSNYPQKMIRRVKRLFVPYVIWNFFFVIFYLSLANCVPRLSTRVATFGLDSFYGAFSKIINLTVAPIDGPLWFLRLIFLLALVSPVVWPLMRIGRGIIAVVICFIWCVLESVLPMNDILHLVAPAYAIACFFIGGVLASNKWDLVKIFKHRGWIALGLIACLVRSAILISGLKNDASNTFDLDLLVTFMSILEAPTLISFVSRMAVDKIEKSKIYNFFKEMSFFAYAGHFLFCSIWLHVVAPMMHGYWNGKFTVLIIVFVAGGMFTMSLIYSLGRRFCPRVLKVFDGSL